MIVKKVFILLLFLPVLLQFTPPAFSAAAKTEVAAAAKKEGNLYIYGDLDSKVSVLLVKEFEALYPGIKVDFITMTAGEVFNRNMRDIAARKVSADILWNSDITLQGLLVKDGYALKYTPAENGALMAAANIADSTFVTGFEPVVMVYNRTLLSEKELPQTRTALLKALAGQRWQGKLAVCDPEKSSLAYLLLTQDLAYGKNFWGQVRKFGAAGLKIYPDYRTLLERVEGGEALAGYNLPLAEVLKVAARDKNLAWVYLTDYTLAIPQTVLITKGATNPNAARLWIDFVRSGQAQQIISAGCNLLPVRSDVAGGEMKKLAGGVPSGQVLRIIGTGTEVTRFSESGLKRGFLLRWKQLLKLVK